MNNESVYQRIPDIIRCYIPDSRVLLFGSRARGDHDFKSDYDLLIVTPEKLSKEENLKSRRLLHWALIAALDAPFDLLLFSEAEIVEKQTLPGHIVRTAIREGIAL